MKIQKTSELRSKTDKDLAKLIEELRKEILDMRIDKSQFKLKDERSIFQKRKNLARALTVMRERKEEKNVKSV